MGTPFNTQWETVLSHLKVTYSHVAFETVIRKLEPLEIDNGCFNVYAPTVFIQETAQHRYHKAIESQLRSVTGLNYKLRLVTEKDVSKLSNDETLISEAASRSGLNSKYKFSNFVKGKSNELAYAASLAIAEKPGKTMYNPLFIYGGVGLGKTHLMHSIGNCILRINPKANILYTTSENFTNEFIDSLKQHSTPSFRAKYRELDVLLLDDVQFMSKKESTLDELFHTFNELSNANKQIVITSDLPPKDLKDIDERLTSRFGNGLIVDITSPDYETRTAILEKKAEQEGVVIPADVIDYIADSIVSNIRELEGALIKIIALSKFGNINITIPMAEREIRAFVSGNDKHTITIDYIIETCADYFSVNVEDIKGKRRTSNIVYPRQIAMYLCRKLANIQSLPVIGSKFGGRDHSTVVYSCDKIAQELNKDIELRNHILELEKRIKGI